MRAGRAKVTGASARSTWRSSGHLSGLGYTALTLHIRVGHDPNVPSRAPIHHLKTSIRSELQLRSYPVCQWVDQCLTAPGPDDRHTSGGQGAAQRLRSGYPSGRHWRDRRNLWR